MAGAGPGAGVTPGRWRADQPADVRAFLAAARSTDERTLAGLVFADWLDDHGRPELADWLRLVHHAEGEFSDLRLLTLELALAWDVELPPPGYDPASDRP